jgi:hypothetical protein
VPVERSRAVSEQEPDARHATGCDRIAVLEAVRELFEQLPDAENLAPTERYGGVEHGPRPLRPVNELEDFTRELAAIFRADQGVGMQR